MTMTFNRDSFITQLRDIVGLPHVLESTDDMQPYLVDWRKRYQGTALAVLRPGSTEEVSAIVKLCAAHRVAIVPQGGNTGMCGGATPNPDGRQIVLSLKRMDAVRDIDTANQTVTVEAGCIL